MSLCIDIGIRNLSMCIMNNSYEILLWDVYNVLDSDDKKCSSLLKNGNICNKKCSMKYTNENIEYFTCKTHFPKSIKANKNNNLKKKNIKNYTLQEIAETLISKIEDIYNINKNIFDKVKKIDIELQPRCNPKMVFISHILYGKMIELYKNSRIPIRFIRASEKLKAYKGPYIKCHLKNKYSQRKWLSIEYTKWFLENKFSEEQKEKWGTVFESYSKKDDLCDSMLMCINAICKH